MLEEEMQLLKIYALENNLIKGALLDVTPMEPLKK